MAAASASFSPLKLRNYPSLPRRYRHVSSCLTADPSPPPDLRAVFTGGGSGGHVYPAIAISDDIKVAHPTSRILFVGTPDGMESKAVRSAGYDYASVPVARLRRPFVSPANLLLPFQLVRSVVASWRILRDFRPEIVVGTGGYVAAPLCLAAVLAGIKIVIQVFAALKYQEDPVTCPARDRVVVTRLFELQEPQSFTLSNFSTTLFLV